MPSNQEKISIAIRQAKSWLEENNRSWYSPFHRKHDFNKELSAISALERTDYTDTDIKKCIKQTGYHKHSVISFLHDNGVKINDKQIDSRTYTSIDATLFFQKSTEERKKLYDNALML